MAMLRSVGTSAFPRAGTTISAALTTTKETKRQQIWATLTVSWAIGRAATERVPREVVAGGEGGAAGRQDGLLGELLHLEQGPDLGDLLRRLLDGVSGGGTVGSGHGDGR
jgi:hypothetical protein